MFVALSFINEVQSKFRSRFLSYCSSPIALLIQIMKNPLDFDWATVLFKKISSRSQSHRNASMYVFLIEQMNVSKLFVFHFEVKYFCLQSAHHIIIPI